MSRAHVKAAWRTRDPVAHGLRGDADGERVLLTAWAPRDAVFLYVNERKEREVVLDPQRPAWKSGYSTP
jgi:hypothetical protein